MLPCRSLQEQPSVLGCLFQASKSFSRRGLSDIWVGRMGAPRVVRLSREEKDGILCDCNEFLLDQVVRQANEFQCPTIVF